MNTKELHIVTGASQGIGREIAISLANSGKSVLAIARSEEKLYSLQDEQKDFVTAYPLDLLDKEALTGFFNFIDNHSYTVSTLINNAGLLRKGPFEESTDDDWQTMFDIHVMVPVRLVRGLLNNFNRPAHIVNVSSMAGFQGSSKFPGLAAYSTAKGALATATEALAAELADRDIRCNALCIGAVKTEMLKEAFPTFEPPVNAEQMGRYIAQFALEADALYNGQVLPVNIENPG